MPEDVRPTGLPIILVLAGDVRDDWTRALAAGGFDVRTAPWLDGLTAARTGPRPELVLVSADLPEGAPRTICTAFRSAVDLARVPLLVVGAGADRIEAEALEPMRADRYVPAPLAGIALVDQVRATLQTAPLRAMPRGPRAAALALFGLAAAAALVRLVSGLQRFREPAAATLDVVAFGVFLAASAGALAVVVAHRPRPFSAFELRRFLGGFGMWIWLVQLVSPKTFGTTSLVAFSLFSAAWAAWSWLGPRVKPRTPGARRAFQLLAAFLLLLAAAPWIAFAWIGEGP